MSLEKEFNLSLLNASSRLMIGLIMLSPPEGQDTSGGSGGGGKRESMEVLEAGVGRGGRHGKGVALMHPRQS